MNNALEYEQTIDVLVYMLYCLLYYVEEGATAIAAAHNERSWF